MDPQQQAEKIIVANSILNIYVTLSGNFRIEDISVEQDSVAKTNITTDFTNYVTAYKCEEQTPYTIQPDSSTYKQGDVLSIWCVKDTCGSIVRVESINNLLISQTNTLPFKYVYQGNTNPELTNIECRAGISVDKGDVCIVKLVLHGCFFPGTSPPDLIVSGDVNVVRGAFNNCCTLRMKFSSPVIEKNEAKHTSRHIKEVDDGSGRGNFFIGVQVTEDSADSGESSSYGASGLLSITVVAAGVVAFLTQI